jgi:hypothetical protein
MVTHLQFIAIAAFLIWGLASSLSGMINPDRDENLISRERGPLSPDSARQGTPSRLP